MGLADRFEIMWDVADDVPYVWARDFTQHHPDDAVSLTLAGAAAMRSAWRVRTNQHAEHVSHEQFKTFWTWLEEAEEHLVRAAVADLTDPTPLVYLLVTGRGLQRKLPEMDEIFEELLLRDPHHLEGHRQRMQFVCDKWFGSHNAMFAFARTMSDRAPANSPLHELLILAHFERYASFRGTATLEERARYFQRPEVRADVELATSRLGTLIDGPPDRRSITVRNLFAFIAWANRDRDAFVAALERIDGFISPMPWNYYGEPLAMVAEAWRTMSA